MTEEDEDPPPSLDEILIDENILKQALMYHTGINFNENIVETDSDKATELYKIASVEGSETAGYMLSLLNESPEKALDYAREYISENAEKLGDEHKIRQQLYEIGAGNNAYLKHKSKRALLKEARLDNAAAQIALRHVKVLDP
tara:strand:+ start:1968 stop:2396 length:429 start_codon:yes stop_codon:yes gene_type:complete